MSRIGIFLFRNEKGIVYDYVKYLLNDMIQNLNILYIVVNGALSNEGRRSFEEYTDNIIVRPDVGFDVGGWQDAILNYCGFDEILKYDELVLFNDSFFGPLYPFSQVFEEMDENTTVDFWGLSSHGAAPGMGNCKYGNRPQYLQTYFLVFRKRLVKTWYFINYWKQLPTIDKFEEVGERFGCVFTKYFEDLGYKWMAYSDTSDLESEDIRKNMSFHTFNPFDMVVKRRFPIIKRKAFITPKDTVLRFNYGDELRKLLLYVKECTDYDLNLIYSYLIASYNLYDLKNSLILNYILPTQKKICDNYKNKKVAIIAHLYYEELFDYCFDYLKNVPKDIDIYITVGNEEKRKVIQEKSIEKLNRSICVRKVNERGRDLAALLVGCNDILLKYDYLCFIHDKKSIQKEYITVGASFCDLLWDNMLKSKQYIYNILNVFEENSHIGLLVPPNVYHGTYYWSSVDYWTICYEKTKQLATALNLSTIIEREKPPISVGTVFWCRPCALKALFEFPFEYTDFPAEPLPNDGSISHVLERILPYVAQHHGFFTATVMNDQYAEVEISNFRYMLSDMQKNLSGIPNLQFRTHKSTIDSLKKMKEDYIFLKSNKSVKEIIKEKKISVPMENEKSTQRFNKKDEVFIDIGNINEKLDVQNKLEDQMISTTIGLKGALVNYMNNKKYPSFLIKIVRKLVKY